MLPRTDALIGMTLFSLFRISRGKVVDFSATLELVVWILSFVRQVHVHDHCRMTSEGRAARTGVGQTPRPSKCTVCAAPGDISEVPI
jgi:hypothetical protein